MTRPSDTELARLLRRAAKDRKRDAKLHQSMIRRAEIANEAAEYTAAADALDREREAPSAVNNCGPHDTMHFLFPGRTVCQCGKMREVAP